MLSLSWKTQSLNKCNFKYGHLEDWISAVVSVVSLYAWTLKLVLSLTTADSENVFRLFGSLYMQGPSYKMLSLSWKTQSLNKCNFKYGHLEDWIIAVISVVSDPCNALTLKVGLSLTAANSEDVFRLFGSLYMRAPTTKCSLYAQVILTWTLWLIFMLGPLNLDLA